MLRAVPQPLPSRERFLEIVAAAGSPRAIAEWLAMNVRRADDGFRLRLDLDAMEALLDDYFAADLWPVLERAEGARAFARRRGGRSDAFDDADRARLDAIAAREPRVHAHRIEGAGHWVHVDAPDALFELVRARPRVTRRPVGRASRRYQAPPLAGPFEPTSASRVRAATVTRRPTGTRTSPSSWWCRRR